MGIQHAVFGIEALDRCSAARRIALAKDPLKIALKQFADMVGHRAISLLMLRIRYAA